MRISFLLLLLNALFFAQIASAASEDTKLKGALLKALKTHDTPTVKALSAGGHESIDRDDVLQERIYNYLEDERQLEIQAKEKAKADVLAKQKAKEKAKTDAIAAKKAAEEKVKTDAIAKQKAEKKAAAAAVAAKKAAEDKKKKDALAAKNKVKADAAAKKKAATVAATAAAVAAKKAKEKKARQAKAAEKKRKDAAAAKKKAAAKKQPKAKKAAPKKAVAAKPKVKAVPKAAVVVPVVAVPVAAAAAPLTIANQKLIGTWKQVSSEKVITLVVEEDTNFMLEQVEDDGTLVISGTWKSEENIFMLSIKKVQRNVHSRETNIHRIYKVDRLSKHRLVLRDKRNRIAYDLKR